MNKYLIITLITLTAVLASCMYIDRTTSDFQNNITLDDLQGMYKNYGESNKKVVTDYLSDIIWPKDDTLNHGIIDTIEIVKHDSKTLIVKAWTGETIIKTSEFVEGRDFNLTKGIIKLGVDTGADFEPEAGALVIHYEIKEIGLDTEGHGKYRSGGVATGVVMLFIPALVGGEEDIRFVRLK